jgi:iron(III) transport system ATP-binding protein
MTEVQGASVEISGIDHTYGDTPVLDQVSLAIAAGESLALLGPSGCGKTTLLRTIAGLERPDRGTICIGGDELVGPGVWVPSEQRQVGMVFQDWALFPHLSVAANVGYGLDNGRRRAGLVARALGGRARSGPRAAGGASTDKAARVAESLELVGLGGLGDRMPSTLSGGQQQRVALARALAPRPRVLLLDEPFSNLDTTMRTEVRTEVHRLLADLGITSIFVTHDQEEAFVIGDRVAVMDDGRIAQIDRPHRLYTSPATRWVAGFVGDAVFLPGTAGGRTVQCALGPLPLDDELQGPVEVLIRPEQLALTGLGSAEDPGTPRGTDDSAAIVDDVEFYGHDAMVHLTMGDLAMRVRVGPEVMVRRGDRVGVAFRSPRARAFPAPGQPPRSVLSG